MDDFSPRRNRHRSRHWIAGLVLIGIGSLFLLERLAIVDGSDLLQFWPFILALFGLGRIIDARNARQVARGGFMVFLACWLYVSIEELWGLNFTNSWPLVLIALGLRHIFVGLAGKADTTANEKL